MKKYRKAVPQLLACALVGAVLLAAPDTAGEGVREGLHLLGTDILPSLFPFLVLSSYLSLSGAADGLCRVMRRPLRRLLRLSENALPALIMGLTGGYPVGAKTVADLYQSGRITRAEAERLLYFVCNVSPAFAVSSVGAVTLRSTASGALLYAAAMLSALTLALLCRFLGDSDTPVAAPALPSPHALTGAVTAGTQAAVSISGWVLTFSVLARLLKEQSLPARVGVFLTAVTEVTTGCKAAAGAVSLPVLAAILGFGGFAVLCQLAPYAGACGVPARRIFASRVVNAALSALYAEALTRLIPQAVPAAELLGTPRPALSAGVPAAALLTVTAAIFILEVDNRRKTC